MQFGGASGVLATLGAHGHEVAERLASELDLRVPSTPWHVVRVGARVEFMCTPRRPRNGSEARAVVQRRPAAVA